MDEQKELLQAQHAIEMACHRLRDSRGFITTANILEVVEILENVDTDFHEKWIMRTCQYKSQLDAIEKYADRACFDDNHTCGLCEHAVVKSWEPLTHFDDCPLKPKP